MIGAIACMQLVEQGKVSLDDGAQIESICPELAKMKILESVDDYGKATFREKKTKITLRMLLTHTCWLNPRLLVNY
jgi:CubicO group peptidase (beta-lactamase class C family)